MNLFIEIEVYAREFKARFLLAAEAANKGFTVYLLSRHEIINLLNKKKLPVGIYHLKDANCSKENIEIYKKLKKLGFLITAQDEEAGILYDDYEDFLKRRFSSGEAFNFFDKFFCYGKRDFKVLDKKFKNKIFVNTGSPRFDLCNKNFYEEKNNFLKKKNLKKYILISSSIQYPIGHRSLADQYDFRINPEFESEDVLMYKEKNFFEKFRQNVEQIPYFINLIAYLSHHLIDFDIVLRPHPNEEISTWQKLIKRIKHKDNIKIIKEGTLIEFINFSECLIQSGCTSAIESYINKKKLVSYIPKNYEDSFDATFGNSLGEIAFNEKEVLNILNKPCHIEDKNLDKLKDRVEIMPNSKFSFQYIVQIWHEIYCHKNNLNTESFNKLERFFFIKKQFYNLKRIFKNFTFCKLNNQSKFEKFPDFNKDLLDKDLNDFIRFDKKYNNIKFKILSNKALKVYSVRKFY